MKPLPAAAAITRARQLFFERGTVPDGLVHDAILRSWQRCEQRGRRTGEAIVFNPVRRSGLDALLDRHRQLVQVSEPAIRQLARSMSGTGYGIILTDSAGICLAAHGPIETCGTPMRQALRQGVDLSENAIGTNAMCAAMAEARPIGIFGAEHYFSQHQSFQCFAAPIFSPQGSLLGAIDISRDTPGPQFGTLSMVLDCAATIENALLLALPSHTVLGLHWRADAAEQSGPALLAFDADGAISALNRAARRLLGLGQGPLHLHYRDLFCGSYGELLDGLGASPRAVSLVLQSGLRIFGSAGSPARPVAIAVPSPAGRSAEPVRLPEFGDAAIQGDLGRAVRALNAGLPVMITGETGTGKEVAAQALHRCSAGAPGPFVAINCGAIPRELIEGELFGYTDGAFTGARRGGAKGRIEEANGGTLFLDEIGDMPLDLQTRLLRVLESREVTRLGESRPRTLAIQLISATHQDLDRMVGEGRFRSDLYFRLSGMPLSLLPLRQRRDLDSLIDTLLAAEDILASRLTPSARQVLLGHDWPGNARELRTALKFARAMAEDGADIGPEHLPPMRGRAHAPVAEPTSANTAVVASAVLTRPLRELEEASIRAALAAEGGNVSAASRRLGISRATLHRRLKDGTDAFDLRTPALGAG
jgi:sigma-54 dependent transcriptional regulator, acetoin dehydrogenase operon transcriptional activator AcoR